MIAWETFIRGRLNKNAIKYLNEYFYTRGIQHPTFNDIRNIPPDEFLNGWISEPTAKQLMLFQIEIS